MAVAETTLGGAGERVRVFEEAPELLQQVGDGDAVALRQVTTQLIRLDPGTWQLRLADADLEGHLGLFVLDGLLTRQVTIGEATCAELLGGGDVLRPWTEIDSEIASIASEARWQVVIPTRVAVLSSRFALQVCRWPTVTASILDRAVQRSRWLSFHLAVCHIVGVEARLLLVLWHFADRWGRVTASGVKLPLPLSHGLLAGIVGARRPTVSTALGVLRDQGRVERTEGGWLLHGDPPVELHELRADVAARKPMFGRTRAAAQR